MKKACFLLMLLIVGALVFAGGGGQSSGSTVSLSLWGGYPEQEPFYKQAAEAYSRLHPNVTIEILTMPLRESEQKYAAAIPSNTSSDIMETSPFNAVKYIEGGFIPALTAAGEAFVKAQGRYTQATIDSVYYNGKAYSMPFFQGRCAMYWNTEMFREAGLTRPPTTFAEMSEYASKLVKYDAQGNMIRSGHSLRVSGQGSGIGQKFSYVLFPMGGNVIIESTTSPGKYHAGYDNDAGRRAFKYYMDALYSAKWDSFNVKHDAEAFMLEQTAMFFRESNVVGDLAKNAPNVKYDVAFIPGDIRRGRIMNPVNFYFSKTCKNIDVATDFVIHMLSDDNQRLMLDTVGWLPSRADVDYSSVLNRKPQYKAFLEYPADLTEYYEPRITPFDEIQTKFADKLANAFLDASLAGNDAAIAKFLADSAAETNTILRQNGLYAE